MPEIDNDLFKVIVVALLAISTLLLLALLSALSGVRKLLKKQLDQASDLREDLSRGLAAPPAQQAPAESFPPVEAPRSAESAPLVGGAAAAATSAPEPVSPSPLERSEPVAWEPEDERPPAGVGATDTSAREDPFATPATDDPFAGPTPSAAGADDPFATPSSTDDALAGSGTGDDPFGTSTSRDEPAAATGGDAFSSPSAGDPFATTAPGDERTGAEEPVAATSAPGAEENPFVTDAGEQPAAQASFDEPEDQPFERNGRWFFRRDNELLVYQEGTGEWVPADPADLEPPAPAPPDLPSPGPSTASEAGDFGSTQTDDTARFGTPEEEPRPAAGGGFWKCPSCGAVNGSSATTCRMCFSARP